MRIRIPHVRRAICALSLAFLAALPLASQAQSQRTYYLPLVPSTTIPAYLAEAFASQEGVVRIVNHSPLPDTVRITAIADYGKQLHPISLSLGAHEAVNLNSRDLEYGNALKGLPEGMRDANPVGCCRGIWQLILETGLAITPSAYLRTPDGLSSMNSTNNRVLFFNRGSTVRKRSYLWLIKPVLSDGLSFIRIGGQSDAGYAPDLAERRALFPGRYISLRLSARRSALLSAPLLEGVGRAPVSGLYGELPRAPRAAIGKWVLRVQTPITPRYYRNPPVKTVNLSRSQTEPRVANLSSVPVVMHKTQDSDWHRNYCPRDPRGLQPSCRHAWFLPFVPPADGGGREGLVRVVDFDNSRTAVVRITAIDDTGGRFGPVKLTLQPGEHSARFGTYMKSVDLSSRDLERGNASKGLPDGIGDGEGNWRLILDPDEHPPGLPLPDGVNESRFNEFTPLGYVRTPDGFVTAMHDVVPVMHGVHLVAFFNPGSNRNKVSLLRLSNIGAAEAEVTISARDDAGACAPGGAVSLTVPAGASRMLGADELEAGGAGFDGSLGDGMGKWRLFVTSSGPIQVMSLLRTRTGHLSGMSKYIHHSDTEPVKATRRYFHSDIRHPHR